MQYSLPPAGGGWLNGENSEHAPGPARTPGQISYSLPPAGGWLSGAAERALGPMEIPPAIPPLHGFASSTGTPLLAQEKSATNRQTASAGPAESQTSHDRRSQSPGHTLTVPANPNVPGVPSSPSAADDSASHAIVSFYDEAYLAAWDHYTQGPGSSESQALAE
ncbi:hypothetical protein FKP32DRAFT_1672528 [Trametes sanguinea]|nr:hypothetical protein FKP32DRAFT_1672528 [Trametes sanguinea]